MRGAPATPAAYLLPRARPDALGIDPAGVSRFLDEVDDRRQELHSLMVVRRGSVVAEGWWSPYRSDGVQLLYSLSKSFTSIAAGFAVADGLLSIDDLVLDHFPEVDRDTVDPRYRRMLVRHLATMTTGHLDDTLARAVDAAMAELSRPRTLSEGFFMVPLDGEPGSVFAYNNTATYLLGEIVRRRTGRSLTKLLGRRFYRPLGIQSHPWDTDPRGGELGFTGLHLTTESVARFGQLLLQHGRLDGSALIDPRWVRQMTRSQVDTNRPLSDPDWCRGYGFQVWMSRHGYLGDGAYGQFCLVLPEFDTVIVLTSATERMQDLLDAVWQRLLPAIDSVVQEDEAGCVALAERLESLALPAVSSRVVPMDSKTAYRFVAGASNAAFGSLQRLTVTACAGGWQLDLELANRRTRLIAGDGHWQDGVLPGRRGPDVPVQLSGGWVGNARFNLEMIADQTSHRVSITGDVGAGTFSSSWNVVPLGASDPTDLGTCEHGAAWMPVGSR